MKPTLVVFDVNGVLYEYDKPSRIAALSRTTGLTPAEVDAAIWTSGFEDSGDAGVMGADDYLRGFGERLGCALTLDAWREALRGALKPIPSMLRLLAQIDARVAGLTNNNLLVLQEAPQLFPALPPLFGKAMCVSAEFRARKPDPEVYLRCLARLGSAPECTLFIDDSRANVDGAERAGLLAHHHTSEAALVLRLRSLGLLSLD